MPAGRPRKPTALLQSPEHIAKRANEPKKEVVILSPPDHLDEEEHKVWVRFASVIADMRISTDYDREALEALVVAWVQAQHLREFFRVLRKVDPLHVFTYDTEGNNGQHIIRARPEVEQLNGLDKKIMAIMMKFGLNPSDRSRVIAHLPPVVDNDPDAEFSEIRSDREEADAH